MRDVDGLLWGWPASALGAARFAGAIGGRAIFTTNTETGQTLAEWMARRRLVWRDFDRGVVWVAPQWIAWLYCLLPYEVSWRQGPFYDAQRVAPFYAWAIHAPTWFLAWLPARRKPAYGARWGVLRFNERAVIL